MDKKDNILIVAPHADDEVLGCGGIISRYKREGKKVFVAIMTNANIGAPNLFSTEAIENSRCEAKNAHNVLNVDNTFFYEFPAPDLANFPAYKISIALNKLFKDENICRIYIPHRGDIHKDHTIIYQAALVAARPINNCPVKEIYAYETLSETEWAAPFPDEAFIPNVFVDISEDLQNKQKAMSCFKSQLKNAPHPRSLEIIEALAKLRGATVGFKYAEAFMLVKSIS